VRVNSLAPAVDAQGEAHTYYKPEETPVAQAAKASYLGRVYLDWAVFPLVQTEPLQGRLKGFLVRFQDLRFAYPEALGRGNLGGWVLLGPDLRVQEEGMSSRRPSVDDDR
jgi:inner membrane protein